MAIIRIDARLVCICMGCISFCLAPATNASTGVDICSEPTAESSLSMGYYRHDESSFEGRPGKTNRKNHSVDLQFTAGGEWAYGAGYRGTILGAEQFEPQTNGYLHTFYFPVHWSSRSKSKSFRASIAPALSASSNVMKDPGEYSSATLQLLTALVWSRPLSDRMGLHYGICGDHRFGDYRVYPVIRIDMQLGPRWSIEFGFPSAQLSHEVSRDVAVLLRISPNGNEWHVKDETLQKQSQLAYEAYLVEWAIDWRALEHFMITASVGGEFHGRYDMTLQDGSRVRLSSDPAARIGVAFAWFF